MHAGLKLFGANAPSIAIIMPVHGTVEFQVAGQTFLSAPGVPFVLAPEVEFSASLSPDTHLFIVQLSQAFCAGPEPAFDNGDPYLVKILKSYLTETLFFKSHRHAMTRTRGLESALILYRGGGVSALPSDAVNELVIEDRRLGRALRLINERLEEGVQLESIARDSGLSLRNLYYLMKKFTGFAPSSYCRSRRLIKARESLIRHYAEVPQVASHALKWGFNHVGRFSSYYHDHFGEYPSDTIKGLESLSKHSEHVWSVEPGRSLQHRAWYTSTISELTR